MHYILTENRIPDDYNTYLPYFQVVFIQINKSFNGTSYQITTIRKIVATQLFAINFKARVFRRKRLVLLSPDLQSF